MEELVFATVIDGIVAFVFFFIWQNEREIRGRLLPLCVLTLLHALLIPLMIVCDSLKASDSTCDILGGIYLFSTPVLFFFIILYSIKLSNRSRMNRLSGNLHSHFHRQHCRSGFVRLSRLGTQSRRMRFLPNLEPRHHRKQMTCSIRYC